MRSTGDRPSLGFRRRWVRGGGPILRARRARAGRSRLAARWRLRLRRGRLRERPAPAGADRAHREGRRQSTSSISPDEFGAGLVVFTVSNQSDDPTDLTLDGPDRGRPSGDPARRHRHPQGRDGGGRLRGRAPARLDASRRSSRSARERESSRTTCCCPSPLRPRRPRRPATRSAPSFALDRRDHLVEPGARLVRRWS